MKSVLSRWPFLLMFLCAPAMALGETPTVQELLAQVKARYHRPYQGNVKGFRCKVRDEKLKDMVHMITLLSDLDEKEKKRLESLRYDLRFEDGKPTVTLARTALSGNAKVDLDVRQGREKFLKALEGLLYLWSLLDLGDLLDEPAEDEELRVRPMEDGYELSVTNGKEELLLHFDQDYRLKEFLMMRGGETTTVIGTEFADLSRGLQVVRFETAQAKGVLVVIVAYREVEGVSVPEKMLMEVKRDAADSFFNTYHFEETVILREKKAPAKK